MRTMSLIPRLLRPLLPLLLLVGPAQAFAQDCPIVATAEDAPQFARPDDPWIYRGTDIPIDREWLMGELPNGLRYAVRQNEVPPCQVSMRVLIDAGSLNERDSERGFAHLLEHMTFRESRDFGPGEAIPHFQRLGAALGADTNATTSPTQTVYKLDLPNANRATLDDSVRLFAGMIREPKLTASNLALDLPIVLAERREQAGAAQRILNATQDTLYTDLRLAKREPIGTLETLRGATAKAVQEFHARWYRPENAVIVLVGDADVEVLARLIEQHFGDWQGKGAPIPAPDFGTPNPPAGADPENPVGKVAAIVEPGQPRSLTMAYLRPWKQVVDNLEYNRGVMLDSLAAAIINERLEARARDGGTFLFAGVERQKVSRSADVTFVSFAPLTEDWQSALVDVRGVIEDALAQPPSQAEIDRAASQFDIAFVNMVEQARIQAGRNLADDVVGAVDIREAVAAPETFLSVFRSMKDRLTPEELLAATHRIFDSNVIRAIYMTGQPGEADEAQLRAALLQPVVASENGRDNGEGVSFADLPPIGTPALPTIRESLGIGGVEKVTFANGVRALLYSRGNEPGRVTVRVRFGAGWRGFEADEAVYATLGEMALVNSGFGPIGQNDLDKLAAGRKLGFDFNIEDGTFTFDGVTRVEDLADQLYLFAAKLAMPRWDAAPVERAKASAKIAYDSYATSANGVLNRDLDWLLRDRDPRFLTPTPEQMDAATPEGFRAVWSRLLAEGNVEVDIFGDVDREQAIAALSRSFGALPARTPLSAEIALRGFAFPAASEEPLRLTHKGDASQAAAVMAWPTGGGSNGLVRSRKLDVLARIFGNRMIDNLRERAGATYSPMVLSDWPLDTQNGGRILALVQMEPALLPVFFEVADAAAADLAAHGPTPDELARVVEPIKQMIARAATGHTFWLNQLEGAAFDDARVLLLPSLLSDYSDVTSEELKALAQQYLLNHGGLRMVVVPENPAVTPAR